MTPVCYFVRFWVDPKIEQQAMAWIGAGGHMAEVCSQPGFLWGRCVRLDEVDSLGWQAYANIYYVESRAALDTYFKSPMQEKFARERAPFAAGMRFERSTGTEVLCQTTEDRGQRSDTRERSINTAA